MTAPVRLRFDRHELAGAFGDLGTDLPLLVALIATCGLDAASVCITFGALQVATGLAYGLPMPVQPLKAMAAIMLAQKLAPGVYAGGGLAIGLSMLVLATTGALGWLARVIPLPVVRGVQLGLGLSLARIALEQHVGSDGVRGALLATVSVVLLLLLRRQKAVPGPLVVMALGAAYALVFLVSPAQLASAIGFSWPTPVLPTGAEVLTGALVLALPQLPLSLGNSVIATAQATRDLFPGKNPSVRRIGITYGLMNLVGPLLGGVPVCHGCGGLYGFYGFGARTGGAPVFYGALFLALGLFFGTGFGTVSRVFPLPLLGVVLLFEALALMQQVRDVAADPKDFAIALLVAVCVVGLPYGYLVGMVAGVLAHRLFRPVL